MESGRRNRGNHLSASRFIIQSGKQSMNPLRTLLLAIVAAVVGLVFALLFIVAPDNEQNEHPRD